MAVVSERGLNVMRLFRRRNALHLRTPNGLIRLSCNGGMGRDRASLFRVIYSTSCIMCVQIGRLFCLSSGTDLLRIYLVL